MRPTLQLRLLGEFSLRADGQPVHLASSARVQAILAYLALHPGTPQTRQHLANLFWPDVTEARARNNLRQVLFQMRRAWPAADRFVAADGLVLGWRDQAVIEVDVTAFERALVQAGGATRGAGPEVPAGLQRAVDLYRGDLLPGFYDEWLEPERERLRQAFRAALVRLMRQREAERDYLAARQLAERRLRLDSLDEEAYGSLMRLQALNDDRAAAVRTYRECEAILQKELGVAPGAALREAYERLLGLERTTAVAAPL